MVKSMNRQSLRAVNKYLSPDEDSPPQRQNLLQVRKIKTEMKGAFGGVMGKLTC